jgi:hypothetical protein
MMPPLADTWQVAIVKLRVNFYRARLRDRDRERASDAERRTRGATGAR